jgi:hypothetical protein
MSDFAEKTSAKEVFLAGEVAKVQLSDEDGGKGVGSWYPGPPPKEVALDSIPVEVEDPNKIKYESLQQWQDLFQKRFKVKYTFNNKWNSMPKEIVEGTKRDHIHGVEIRQLPKGHPLAGEYGLFATRKFSKYDIIGEYVGKIVGKNVGGHYVAVLEDKDYNESLGIDAETTGNEMRFINSFLNVDFKANVIMKTAYVNMTPHIMIVCKEDIDIGDELLLDYGDEYNKAYLTPKPEVSIVENKPVLSKEKLQTKLPFVKSGSESDTDTDSDQEKRK